MGTKASRLTIVDPTTVDEMETSMSGASGNSDAVTVLLGGDMMLGRSVDVFW
ncbi:hypothetical protein [Mycobacterium lepromatosis]|uniref:hypothetical protein n=1 Tax=Mycobacterium lepromatosis TaxID=480418 RepID=UPI000B3227B8|nr:hypothetical protein [Mycobacterium lepromatosis]